MPKFPLLILLVALVGTLGCTSKTEDPPALGQVRAKVVSGVSPLSGPAGTVVTLSGSEFTGATLVTFASSTGFVTATGSGVPAIFTVVDDTKITATVPAGTVSGFIQVMTPSGMTASPELFTVVSSGAPIVFAFDPPMGGEGSFVSVHGLNLTGATGVEFNGLPVNNFYLADDGHLGTWVPKGASTGPITVTNTIGTAASPTNFIILPPPVVTAIAPSSGKPGDSVKITGTGFTGAADVCFGGGQGGRGDPVPAGPTGGCSTFTIDSDIQITVTVPSGAQSGYISVSGPGGWAQSPTPFTVLASAVPKITSFDPVSGGFDTRVEIVGTGFTGTTAVKFNGLLASFHLTDDTGIVAYVPPNATTGPISVTNSLGTATSGSNFTIVPPPTITLLSPTSGKPGDTFTITGTALTGATAVCIGDAKTDQPIPQPGGPAGDGGPPVPTGPNGCATFTVVSATQITVTVPLGASSGSVRVSTPGGSGSSPMAFTVLSSALPTITSFSPNAGGGRVDVLIEGTNFTGTTAVTFNGMSASFYLYNDTTIRANLPPGATTGPIAVTNTLGTATTTNDFVVIPPPSITGFSPSSAKPGDTVTVNGSGFTGAYSVCLGYSGGADRKPSEGPAGGAGGCPAFTVVSDTQLTFTVPSGVSSGPILVNGPGGMGQSLSDLTILSSAPPVVSSFSPASGGIATDVLISGSNFTGTVGVTFNGLSAPFTVYGDNQIHTWVPSGATTGKIAVINTEGTGTSATNFTVVPPPVVAGFSPGSGQAGDPVVITGSNFSQVSRVSFNDRDAQFQVLSNTQIIAYVPSGASTGPIDVGGTKTATDFVVESSGPPMIIGFSPTSGSPGSFTIVYGGNFAGTTEVLFNGKPAGSFGVESDSRLHAYVPQGAATGPITVTNSKGSATSSGDFTVLSPPTISALQPNSGKVGDTVVITGTGFLGVTSVRFGGDVSANFTVDSDVKITTAVPDGAVTGRIELNQSVSSPGVFTVLATDPPTISGFSPTSGSVGANVTLTGSGFNGVTGVTFGGVAAFSFNPRGDSLLEVRVPPGAVTGPIAVTNSLGTATTSASFTVIPPPSITSFSPASGAVGSTVTITGTGFTGAKSVSFGATSASSFSVVSNTSLTAVVPAGATTGPLHLTTLGGEAFSSANFTVLSSTTPKITGFTPTSGGVGADVVITGSGFTGTTSVTFNGVGAPGFVVKSDTQIDVSVPAGATTGPLSVTNTLGTSTTTASFTVIPAPTLSGFSPTSAKVGDTLTLTGTNLQGTTGVSIGGHQAASFVVVNSTTVTAVVAPGTVTGPVSLTTPGGTAVASGVFKLLSQAAPTISTFSPTTGGAGATVRVVGTGFAGATAVAFNGVPTSSFTIDDDTVVSVMVPTGATSGPISVTNNVGTGTSSASFTVIPPPTITSFTPTGGVAGDSVVITGMNFTGTTQVAFGLYAKAPAAFTVDSPTKITATVPPGATNGPIQVVTGGGTAISTASFTVSSSAPPTITSFTPTSGGPTTLVIIQGTGFTGVTGVKFNGVPSSLVVTDKGDTFVVATVPPGATTGPITVTNTVGSATSKTDFVIDANQALTITGVTPSSGPPGTIVTITGNNLQGADVRFFSEQPAMVISGTNTSLTVEVPAGAQTGPIIVMRESSSGGINGAIWDLFTVYATSCSGRAPGTPCGLCSACNAQGACAAATPDDSGCGVIDCGGLDTACRDFSNVTQNRCASQNTCKAAPAACTSYVDLTGPCDDGDACTAGETCKAGVCGTPASVVTCPAADACHSASVCDPATGLCGAPVPIVTCRALDECHDVGVCDGATGQCTHPPKADGTGCDDGSACTSGETCQAGVCGSAASTVVCVALDTCHVAGTCDPVTGSCTKPIVPNGTACSDSRACTTGDSCQAGTCVPTASDCPCATDADCFALDQCHDVGTCDLSTNRCSTPQKADRAPCNDANACTVGETCQAGACGAAPQRIACTPPECQAGVCNATTGTCDNTPAPDGTPCNAGVCVGGACSPTTDGGRADAGSAGTSGTGGASGGAGTASGGAEAGTGAAGSGAVGTGAGGSGGVPSSGAGGAGATGTGATSSAGTGAAGSTGTSAADAGPDAGPANPAAASQDEGGCGCRVGTSDGDSKSSAAIALLALTALRRRKNHNARVNGARTSAP